jgi:hypothetical protein
MFARGFGGVERLKDRLEAENVFLRTELSGARRYETIGPAAEG